MPPPACEGHTTTTIMAPCIMAPLQKIPPSASEKRTPEQTQPGARDADALQAPYAPGSARMLSEQLAIGHDTDCGCRQSNPCSQCPNTQPAACQCTSCEPVKLDACLVTALKFVTYLPV